MPASSQKTRRKRSDLAVSLDTMSFERPEPDLVKLVAAWESWENGDEAPGKTLANLKTAGLADVLKQMVSTGWTYEP